MAGAGTSKSLTKVEEIMKTALERMKMQVEDEVFQYILQYQENLQGLHFLWENEMATTPKQQRKLEKYRARLHEFNVEDVFRPDNLYELILVFRGNIKGYEIN